MTNACLVLFVVAVGLHRSYGQYAIGRNCDSTSDCHYSNAGCIKYEQCTTGVCDCAPGYRSGTIEGRSLCKKLKKIGESCDVVNDQCFDGECKGVCSCQRGKHASVDKEHCVGNLYGEKCRQKQFNIYDWSHYTCEAGKGLKCDVDTDKCVCVDGMKRVGDHCEFYKLGETCDHTTTKASDKKTCEAHLICDGSKECACSSITKEHTFKMKVFGVVTEYKRCVDKDATLNLKVSEKCIADYSKRYTEDEANVCGDYLYCGTCVESANEYLNNTKCLAVGEIKAISDDDVTTANPNSNLGGGADSQRMNAAVSLGLVMVAFFAMLR